MLRATGKYPAASMELHKGREVVHPATLEAWRSWLAANHARTNGVWLASWRRATGRPVVPYEELVEEALCFGWIDGVVNSLDDERTAILVTPRRRGSGWSRSNKDRVDRLTAAGRMAPAGLDAINRARADGSWSLLDAAEALEEPDDLVAALDAEPAARRHWNAFPPGARKGILAWITLAKRPETRARRIATTVREAAQNRRANG